MGVCGFSWSFEVTMVAFSRLGLSGLALDMDWFGYRPGNIICVRMMAQGRQGFVD